MGKILFFISFFQTLGDPAVAAVPALGSLCHCRCMTLNVGRRATWLTLALDGTDATGLRNLVSF